MGYLFDLNCKYLGIMNYEHKFKTYFPFHIPTQKDTA